MSGRQVLLVTAAAAMAATLGVGVASLAPSTAWEPPQAEHAENVVALSATKSPFYGVPKVDAAGWGTVDSSAIEQVRETAALRYLAAVEAERKAEAARKAEAEARKRAEEARKRAAAAPAPAATPVGSGACGGWEGLIAAHFPADQVGRACRVMLCESNGNANAANPGSKARGLFQIMMSVHDGRFYARGWSYDDWRDPAKNTAIAAEIWRGSGWSPWVCRG